VFLVTGLDNDFNLRRIERFLTVAWDSGARPVIVLNKTDLCPAFEERVAEVEAVALGIPVHPVCAREADTLAHLHQYLIRGQTVALLGSSGVGKSTITNTLLGTERQAVKAIRESDGRGRHTTSRRELILLPEGGLLIDNPGMREIQLWGDEETLKNAFADVEELTTQCRFRSCRHEGEPGCAVQEALAEEELDSHRYRSYLKLKREFKLLELRKDQRARLSEKSRWRKVAISERKRKKTERGSR
jgi:ribosome biogenesis GTPase